MLRWRTALPTAVAIAAVLTLCAWTSGNFRTIRWDDVTPATVYRTEGIGGVVEGRLWVLGGFQPDPFAPTKTTQVFDPATGAWSRGPDLLEAISHQAMAVDRHLVYLAGGFPAKAGAPGGQQVGTRNVWRLDTRNGRWVRMPPLPSPRGSGALVFLDRTLHYFGGNDEHRADVGTHWSLALDVGPWQWIRRADMPNPRSHLAGVALNGRIYGVGGQHGYDDTLVTQKTVSVYDPATNVWSSAAELPQALSHISAATFVHAGRILMFGGTSTNLHAVRQTYAFTPGSGWVQMTPLPESRYSGVGGVIAGKLYYVGGSAYGGPFQLDNWRGTAIG